MDSEPHSVVIDVKNGGKVQKVQNKRKESAESPERKEGKSMLKGDKVRLKGDAGQWEGDDGQLQWEGDESQLEEVIINLAFHRGDKHKPPKLECV
jgi:hypothetical protein